MKLEELIKDLKVDIVESIEVIKIPEKVKEGNVGIIFYEIPPLKILVALLEFLEMNRISFEFDKKDPRVMNLFSIENVKNLKGGDRI